jgi:hypothetical protein
MATKTIASGQSLTGAINLDRNTLGAVGIPDPWTAADLTFQASMDGTTFFDMRNAAGVELQVPVTAGDWISFDLEDFAAPLEIKIRSGTSGTPVNQGADRVLTYSIVRR